MKEEAEWMLEGQLGWRVKVAVMPRGSWKWKRALMKSCFDLGWGGGCLSAAGALFKLVTPPARRLRNNRWP